MHAHQAMWKVPAAAVAVLVLTIIACVAINLGLRHDNGDLVFPYISQNGVHSPERYVFLAGLSVAAVLLAWSFVLNHRRWKRRDHNSTTLVMMAWLACFPPPCLVLLAVFSIAEHSLLHTLFAGGFFVTAMAYIVADATMPVQPPSLLKLWSATMTAVLSLLYLFVAMVLVCDEVTAWCIDSYTAATVLEYTVMISLASYFLLIAGDLEQEDAEGELE